MFGAMYWIPTSIQNIEKAPAILFFEKKKKKQKLGEKLGLIFRNKWQHKYEKLTNKRVRLA